MERKMSVDEFLSAQATPTSVATVEAVENEPELLKLTPWVSGVGCLCQLAVKIPKKAIESVSPTGDTHYCCNKALRVVEVHFRKDSSLPLSDLFAQLMQSAQGGHAEQTRPFAPQARPFASGAVARAVPVDGLPIQFGGLPDIDGGAGFGMAGAPVFTPDFGGFVPQAPTNSNCPNGVINRLCLNQCLFRARQECSDLSEGDRPLCEMWSRMDCESGCCQPFGGRGGGRGSCMVRCILNGGNAPFCATVCR